MPPTYQHTVLELVEYTFTEASRCPRFFISVTCLEASFGHLRFYQGLFELIVVDCGVFFG